jgi:hypothetical protein
MTKRELQKYFGQWKRGVATKEDIERTFFGVTNAKGKYVTRVWQQRLGLDTRYGRVTQV